MRALRVYRLARRSDLAARWLLSAGLAVLGSIGSLASSASVCFAQHSDPYASPSRDEAVADEHEPREVFFDQVTVNEVSVVVRVTDRRGQPILGLGAEDLDVRVGGVRVPVAALHWVASGASASAPGDVDGGEGEAASASSMDRLPSGVAALPRPDAAGDDTATADRYAEDGRLMVIFVQIGHHQVVTLDESWVTGHLKALPAMQRLLASLSAADRVAVVSFDSQLKLWQDFSRDREATAKALFDAIGFGTPSPRRAAQGPSLFDSFDFAVARDTTSPEAALRVLGDALQTWREPKEIIFLGWGLGRLVGGRVSMPPVYAEALARLHSAQTTVHVLNVVQMGGNALASGLIQVAEATGGTYSTTFEFGRRKIERLARVLVGYYLLTLDPGDFPGISGRLRVRLAEETAEETGVKARDVSIHHRRQIVAGS